MHPRFGVYFMDPVLEHELAFHVPTKSQVLHI